MGKFLQGINGPFSGRVGPVVGASWMGMAVMRRRPKKRTKPFSPAELRQQAKFRMMNQFLLPMISLLNVTFKHLAVRMSGFNKAFSYNVKNAITGIHPELKIDYSMVLLSRGDLPNAGSPAATVTDGKLMFTWTDNSGKGQARGSDKAFVAAYCEDLNNWIAMMDVALRSDGSCGFDLNDFAGKSVHTYIGFISEDGKNVADSLYAGLV